MNTVRILAVAILLVILAVVMQLELLHVVFQKLGVSEDIGFGLLIFTVIGSLINIPVTSIASLPGPTDSSNAGLAFPPDRGREGFNGKTLIAVNVGGAVVPVCFSIYLMWYAPVSLSQAGWVVAAVSLMSYLASSPIRGVGIGMPVLVAPITAALASILVNQEFAAPLAYIGGTFGVLIGADILHLNSVRQLGAPIASIGGAGTFDGIFLTGVLAVLLT